MNTALNQHRGSAIYMLLSLIHILINLEAYTAYYRKFIFAHKVVNLIYGACRAVFDRQYAVAAKPVLNG